MGVSVTIATCNTRSAIEGLGLPYRLPVDALPLSTAVDVCRPAAGGQSRVERLSVTR